DDLLVDIQQVVGPAMPLLHHDLAAGDALGREKVECLLVLHRPTGIIELAIDEYARTLLRRQPRVVITGVHCRQPSHWLTCRSSARRSLHRRGLRDPLQLPTRVLSNELTPPAQDAVRSARITDVRVRVLALT